ncbi:hypothetical protein HK098_004291 [Nowakowskiella sp. JEL0407]|nr:hypothetical protein HK098_004291 [Nowakowskiella sp. JEL0407]
MSAAEDTYVDPLKSTSAENLVGGVLIGASIFLTVHSIMRMSLMNITKRWEFPFMNGAMVINEVAMLFYMFASEKVFGSIILVIRGQQLRLLRIQTAGALARVSPLSQCPSYQYAELFSTAFTFFNLTEFGLNLRVLYSKTDTSNAQNSKSQSVNTKIISKPNNDSPSPGATAPKRSYSATSMSSLPTEINHLDPQANVEFVSQSDHYSVYNNQQQQQNSWGFQDHSSFPSAYVAPQALTSFDTYSNNTSPRESIDGYTGLRRPSLRQTTTKLFGGYDNSTSRVQQNSFTTIPIYSA